MQMKYIMANHLTITHSRNKAIDVIFKIIPRHTGVVHESEVITALCNICHFLMSENRLPIHKTRFVVTSFLRMTARKKILVCLAMQLSELLKLRRFVYLLLVHVWNDKIDWWRGYLSMCTRQSIAELRTRVDQRTIGPCPTKCNCGSDTMSGPNEYQKVSFRKRMIL